jgi:hypothetical protein
VKRLPKDTYVDVIIDDLRALFSKV